MSLLERFADSIHGVSSGTERTVGELTAKVCARTACGAQAAIGGGDAAPATAAGSPSDPEGGLIAANPRHPCSMAVSWNFSDAEFKQYRSPVGRGPSSNTWPRCPSHRVHRISVRTMP
jgi:hypothetical protein